MAAITSMDVHLIGEQSALNLQYSRSEWNLFLLLRGVTISCYSCLILTRLNVCIRCARVRTVLIVWLVFRSVYHTHFFICRLGGFPLVYLQLALFNRIIHYLNLLSLSCVVEQVLFKLFVFRVPLLLLHVDEIFEF